MSGWRKRTIMEMAREVKMPYDFVTGEPINIEKLEAFAKLVREDALAQQALADHTEDNLKMVAPVGKYTGETWDGSIISLYDEIPVGTLLYTTPPQRTWVGLTDEEIWSVLQFRGYYKDNIEIAKAIEAKLKEKNT